MGTVQEFAAKGNRRVVSAEALADVLKRAVDARVGCDATFERREAAALALTNDATRLFLAGDLKAISDHHGPYVEVDGLLVQAPRAGDGAVLQPVWGDGPRAVDVPSGGGAQRTDHCAPGPRGGRSGADDAGPRVADHIGVRERPYAQCRGGHDGRSSLPAVAQHVGTGRQTKALGTAATQVAPQIERRVRQAERVPDGAVAIALGLDRTAVPMEEDLADGESRGRRRTRPYVRTPPTPVTVNYRMAYVGTVSFHDAEGTELATRHYSAGAHESPADRLVQPMLADLRHALRQDPTLAVGVVQDGAPELWHLLSEAVVAEPLVTRYYEAIDRYHLTEHMGELLRSLDVDEAARTTQLSRWNDSLDQNDMAIYRIRAWVRDQHAAARRQHDGPRVAQIDPHLTYLENNASLMRYARLRAVGLPVGSGVTEGACKSVIKMRTNGSGQRWRPQGLTAVLTLRSLHLSDRLPRFWANFSRRYRNEVLSLCA